MTLSNNQMYILRALRHAGGVDCAIEDFAHCLTGMDRGGISSRLCKMRKDNLVTSEMTDGKNHWTLTDAGAAVLEPPDISPDIHPETGIPVTEQNQPIDGDIVPDMTSRADDILSGKSDYAVADILVSESQRLNRRTRFHDLPDALFVIDSLSDYCADMPGYQGELARIADYLRMNAV